VLAQVDSYRLQPVTDLQAEVSRLKRELAIACEERDILKKATAPWLGRAVAALRNCPSEVRLHSREISRGEQPVSSRCVLPHA
jgi:transposase-like protein